MKSIQIAGIMVDMELDEVILKFGKQVKFFAYECEKSIKTHLLAKDDFEQIGFLALINAYETYDNQYAFATHLQNKLRGEKTKILSNLNAQKRNSLQTISLDEKTDCKDNENTSVADIIGVLDGAIEELAGEDLVSRIFNMLNDEEKNMYLYIIEKEVKPAQYADMIGVSRQNLNYKLGKLRKKLEGLYLELTA